MSYYRKPTVLSTTILSGQTTSAALHLRDYVLVGLIMPAAFTGTTITFTASDTLGGTYVTIYDSSGAAISATVAASRAIGLTGAEVDAVAPWQFVKLVSGSAEGADRIIKAVKK
jgi:hypothetical protein